MVCAPEHISHRHRKAMELLLSRSGGHLPSCKAAAKCPLRRENTGGWGREGTFKDRAFNYNKEFLLKSAESLITKST